MEKLLKHPKLIVAVVSLITVFFALQFFNLELDNNNFRFVPQDDEARLRSVSIDDTFGSSLFILVGLEREYGSIFDAQFLQRIKEYVQRIEQIEVVGTVNSIMSTDYITASDDTISVEKLVGEDFSGTPEELALLKSRLLSWNMYERALLSDDFTATQILVPLDITVENAGNPEAVNSFLAIRDIAHEMFAGSATVYVAGMPVISAAVNESIHADLKLLVPLVIVVLLVIVWIPLKDIKFVFLSLLGVLIAAVWSIGAMPLFGVKLSVITTIIPVVLIAVGNSYGLHVIIHYMEGAGKDFSLMSREEHTAFVIALMRKVITPIFLAALTTFVSFISFCFTKVIPVREFGAFAAFGVLSSFVVALVLIPAILILRGPKPLRSSAKLGGSTVQQKLNDAVADFIYDIVQRKRIIIFFTAVISIICAFGAFRLIVDNVFVEYFEAESDLVKSDRFIREKFGGSKIISVVLEAESSEIILHPDTLSALDGLNTYLMARVPEVGKVMGFTDLIKRINQVFNVGEDPQGIKGRGGAGAEESFGSEAGFGFFGEESFGSAADFGFFDEESFDDAGAESEDTPLEHEAVAFTLDELLALFANAGSAHRSMNASDLLWEIKKLTNYEGSAYYEVPVSLSKYGKQSAEELQMLVSNYLVLLAGNINDYANDPLEPTAIRTTVQLRTEGQIETDRAIACIHEYVQANFPANVSVIVGGTAEVEGSLNTRIVNSLWTAIAIAIISLFCIIALVNHSVVAGFVSIVPLCLLIVINIGIMGFTGIKLNIGTALIASLTLGIGIDYTIHFLEAYKYEYRNHTGNFLKAAYRTAGLAVITDGISTGLGFAVLMFSNFIMLAQFGLLTALSILLSSLVGLIVVPVLLLVSKPRFIESQKQAEPEDLSPRSDL
ncbi:MAG: MMPL family transporter [Spirochaetaceae bacterium]|jgi:predicted RND superfamily exporter protein|nr:MMPL family transporter [Spirochaetaceae bacterium]